METIKLIVPGNLDTEGAMQFEKTLEAYPQEAQLELDFSNVDFMASSGVRIVLKLAKANKLVLSNVKPNVHLVFKIAGLDAFLEFI